MVKVVRLMLSKSCSAHAYHNSHVNAESPLPCGAIGYCYGLRRDCNILFVQHSSYNFFYKASLSVFAPLKGSKNLFFDDFA